MLSGLLHLFAGTNFLFGPLLKLPLGFCVTSYWRLAFLAITGAIPVLLLCSDSLISCSCVLVRIFSSSVRSWLIDPLTFEYLSNISSRIALVSFCLHSSMILIQVLLTFGSLFLLTLNLNSTVCGYLFLRSSECIWLIWLANVIFFL